MADNIDLDAASLPGAKERFGLWLARMALLLTGNRELANVSKVLPLIPQRRLAISPESLDLQSFGHLSGSEWRVWNPSPASDLGKPG